MHPSSRVVVFFFLTAVLLALPASAATVSYTYDHLNRLTSALSTDGYLITYSYDGSSNRSSMRRLGNGFALVLGDIDGDLTVSLRDAVLSLQILAGTSAAPAAPIYPTRGFDPVADRITLANARFILQKVAAP